MKYCPDCNAPNPQARTECFACKQPLDKTAGPPPPQAEPPDSAAPLPAGVVTGLGRVPKTPLPGWEAEPLPDGMVRLRRTTGGRWLRDAWVPGGLIIASLFFIGKFLTRGADAGSLVTLAWGGVTLLTLIATAASLAWEFASGEELNLGPKFLQYRKHLGRFEKTWQVDGMATLRIETSRTGSEYGRDGAKTTRTLYAEHGAQSHAVDYRTGEGSHYGMKYRTVAGMLSDAMGGANWGDEMVLMARYLSEQIGWPVYDDQVASATR